MKKSDLKILFFDVGGILLSNGWAMSPGTKQLKNSALIIKRLILCTISFSTYMK
jgi:hypothetical protein